MAKKAAATGGSDGVGAAKPDGDEGPSKSELIRAAIKAHPKAPPKEIAEIVNKQVKAGQEVKASYVSIIKSQDKKKGGKGGKKVSGKVKAAAKKLGRGAGTIPADLGNALDTVIAANKLLASAGSADAAKAIIDRLTWGVTVTG